MKESTIEEKAKAYDEALIKAKGIIKDYKERGLKEQLFYAKEDLEYIFPELKESEDERIRKEIIIYLKRRVEMSSSIPAAIGYWIAWLEKQGENTTTLPKWKYKKDNAPLLRDSIILNKYGCVAKSPSGALVSDVWVIDYDELAKLPKEEFEKQDEQKPYASETMNEKGDFDSGFTKMMENEQKPAEWSSEQKHTLQTDNVPYESSTDAHLWTRAICFDGEPMESKPCEQKSSWSEDDKQYLEDTLTLLEGNRSVHTYGEVKNWLKNLRGRVQPQQKQEWGEEDEKKIKKVMHILSLDGKISNKELKSIFNWLKSLRPQSHWKPSEGQLECLGYAIDKAEKDWSPLTNNRIYLTLKALKEQLEKL